MSHIYSDSNYCHATHSAAMFYVFSPLTRVCQVLITGVLSFLQKRAKRLLLDRRLPFLEGRFAIVV